MSVIVDFYLRDQIVRGELAAGQGRPLDLLNNKLDNFITLVSGLSRSLHAASEPTKLGQTRLHKDQLIMAIPHEERQALAAPIRGGWVEKRLARVIVGLGPLVVSGNLHFGQWESVAPGAIWRNPDGRAFLPATEARVTSHYHPSWAVEAHSVFLARAAISYISLVSTPNGDAASHARATDDTFRPRHPGTPNGR